MNRRLVGSRTSLHTLHKAQKSDSILCVCVHNTHGHTHVKTAFIYYKLLISLQRFGRFDSFHNKNLEDTKTDYYSRTRAERSKLKQTGLSKWTLSMYYDDNYDCLKSDPHDDWKIYVRTLLKCSSCQVISSMLRKTDVFFITETNKCITYIYLNKILYIVRTPRCFDSSATPSGSLNVLVC
jgi:hypothetical protein